MFVAFLIRFQQVDICFIWVDLPIESYQFSIKIGLYY